MYRYTLVPVLPLQHRALFCLHVFRQAVPPRLIGSKMENGFRCRKV